MKKYIIILEALISAGIVLYFSYDFLFMVFLGGLIAAFSPRPYEVLYAPAALAIIYTLAQYLILAIYTAFSKKYHFGILFWLGLPGILVAIYLKRLSQISISQQEILILAPLIFSFMHFMYLQIRGFHLKTD